MVVERGGLPAADVDALLRAEPTVAGFHREAWVRVDVPQASTSILVRALDGDWRALPWRVLEGSFVAEPGEIALGTSATARSAVRPGDVIEAAVGPLRARWRVTGTYLDLTNGGFSGAVAWETLADMYPRLEPVAWLVRIAPGADPETVRQRLRDASGGRLTVTRAGFEPPAAVRTAQRVVDGLALLLGGLAVLAVIQSVTATVREQRRDIAILKVIGMTPAQLVAATAAGVAVTAAAGAGAGLLVGAGLARAGFAAGSAVSGLSGLAPLFPWAKLAACALAAPGLAALAALPAAAAAARAPAAVLGGEHS